MTTRCLGLTRERRRCSDDAINGSGYCAEHAHFAPAINAPPPMRGLARWLGRNSHGIADDARFSIAASLKKKSTPALAEILLNDANTFTRWSAAFALRQRRDMTALEPLWDAIHRDPVALVRQQCAVAIGKLGTGAALGPLIETLWHDRDSGVRQACAVALGNLGITHVSQELLDVLGREHSAFVRWDCVVALGQVADGTAEPPLKKLAKTEPAQVIRNACRDAVEAIRRRLAVE